MPLNQPAARLLKIALTLILAALALFTLWHLYVYYTYSPQTRDGKVRADIVALAADVSGRVDAVMVRDNQHVRRGDILFTIDQARLANDVSQAEAEVAYAQAQREAAQREYRRYLRIRQAIASQDLDARMSAARQASASLLQAQARLARARLELDRAQVRAPVNGTVTNFSLRVGAYAAAGEPVMALVDEDSYYVAGYFEETKLSHIHEGMRATVHIMGEPHALTGRVESFSAGIEDRERTTSSGTLLANVNPTFNWIRLAQRIPVRITLDEVPDGVHLIAGRTASVLLEEPGNENGPPATQQ